MTIVEEIDKKSNRPHRSKNIVDAMKYLFSAAKTPQNIAEAVKGYSGGGSGEIKTVTITYGSDYNPGTELCFSDGTYIHNTESHEVNWIVGAPVYIEAVGRYVVMVPRNNDKYTTREINLNGTSKVFITPVSDDIESITVNTSVDD